MSTRSFLIPEDLDRYITPHWISEPDILRELRDETQQTMRDSNMQISPGLGQFLTVLLKATGARRTLEVGVFTGYSSTVTALALPEDGRIVACDISEEFTGMARRYWARAGVAHKIDLKIGPALESLQGLEGPFDFAFIDADKENYWAYFERAIELLRPGGLIAVDNVLWSGKVADASNEEASTIAIRDFNRRVHEDARVIASLVPIGDGVTLAVKL